MADINLQAILNQDGGQSMVEEYLEKSLLERPMRKAVFTDPSFGSKFGIPTRDGQYIKLTQRKSVRRTQRAIQAGKGGSDPASGIKLNNNQIQVPMEWSHEYADLEHITMETSWDDLEAWVKEDMPEALEKTQHELAQNAMAVGRYKPGQYDAAGDPVVGSEFYTTVEATVTLFGNSFTFQSCPKYYAGGAADFNALQTAGTNATLDELNEIAVRLGTGGIAPVQNGKYVCVLSDAMMHDILEGLSETQKATIQNPNTVLLKGYEDRWLGSYGKLMFISDEIPYTENDAQDAENVRVDWGGIQSAFILGKGCLGYFALGGKGSGTTPKLKMQDITKTGYATSFGYTTPSQVAVVNQNAGAVYKAKVSIPTPNNYSATNKQEVFEGETLYDAG
jgi:hypothetical protein